MERRYLQIGNSFIFDETVQKLSNGAFRLYLSMAMEAGGKSTVAFPHGAANKYGISSTSFDRWVKELLAEGFIERIEDGSYAQFAPAVYKFVFDWKQKTAPQIGEGNKANLPQLGVGRG